MYSHEGKATLRLQTSETTKSSNFPPDCTFILYSGYFHLSFRSTRLRHCLTSLLHLRFYTTKLWAKNSGHSYYLPARVGRHWPVQWGICNSTIWPLSAFTKYDEGEGRGNWSDSVVVLNALWIYGPKEINITLMRKSFAPCWSCVLSLIMISDSSP